MAKRTHTHSLSEGGERGYPRPQLERSQWTNLNGAWSFTIDVDGTWRSPSEATWSNQTIIVPFAPESPASGINDSGFYKAVWYRRSFKQPALQRGERAILHFGAVDYHARVWVNGRLATEHEGGYTPFSADITDLLLERADQEIVVQAIDDPADLSKPRGKQDWRKDPHSIWYYRTTGIWQTVWMEIVPASYIRSLTWGSNVQRWELSLDAKIEAAASADLYLDVKLTCDQKLLLADRYHVEQGGVRRIIGLTDPGIDDFRNDYQWYPYSPKLIEAEFILTDSAGKMIDRVSSYTAMRQVEVLENQFVLNGKPHLLMMMLDQGYWPESGLTAPNDAALKRDVELIKAMGFNGVRKHQKIEDPRFLYWADRLGIFVWEEMPSAYAFTPDTAARVTRQWIEAIQRDISHPCIITWVPFNESWGVPDLPISREQRDLVRGIYHLTRSLDPSRPCIGNDGWEAVEGDIVGIHDYDADPRKIAARYASMRGKIADLLQLERPGKKVLTVEDFEYQNQPIMLTEFGGIAFSKDAAHTWGYSRARTSDDLAGRYAHLLAVVRNLPIFSGFCYTQFTDTYQEANGLLYMDRTPKFPIEQIAIATRGPQSEEEVKKVEHWRKGIEQRLADLDRSRLTDIE